MKKITIELADEVMSDIETMAANQKKDVKTFLLEHIVLAMRNGFVRCPECKKPLYLQEDLPCGDDKFQIECSYCGHSFEYEAMPD